jgi:hypothetical protein
MCTENVKEKTELLYALINGRKLVDLPKINKVSFSAIKLGCYFFFNYRNNAMHALYLFVL